MERKIIYSIIIGIVLFTIGTIIRIFINQGIHVILYFITPIITGFVVKGFKRGFIVGFLLSILYIFLNYTIFSPSIFAELIDINFVFTLIFFIIIDSAIAGVLGGIGGILGKRILQPS